MPQTARAAAIRACRAPPSTRPAPPCRWAIFASLISETHFRGWTARVSVPFSRLEDSQTPRPVEPALVTGPVAQQRPGGGLGTLSHHGSGERAVSPELPGAPAEGPTARGGVPLHPGALPRLCVSASQSLPWRAPTRRCGTRPTMPLSARDMGRNPPVDVRLTRWMSVPTPSDLTGTIRVCPLPQV
jgi:hypothetical protein